ncbi:substrate binding domain-containing protein [Aeromonas veronii]|uniref:substrate binding domain-containing protein n=1 Tax=Aeromonas veronii TaxID=654 RepID=UPI001F247772|nr:substrate binding domain-containing protein [Aeromonas veronii]
MCWGWSSGWGGKLFHKTTRQQTLTELGQLFLSRCQRVLEELALTESLTQNLLAEPAGRLRIAAPLSFGHHRLVPLLPAFLDRYPKLDLDLQLTPRWVDLVEEGFDAAIRTLRPQDEALIARPLLTQHYRLCAAPDYLNRHGVPRHPADLARHQCLHGNWGEHERWQFVGEDGQSEEVRVASRLRINHWPALLTAALSGAGITLQPAEQVRDHIAAGRLLPLLGRYQSPAKTLYFIYPAARRQVLKITLLGDFLAESLQAEPEPE